MDPKPWASLCDRDPRPRGAEPRAARPQGCPAHTTGPPRPQGSPRPHGRPAEGSPAWGPALRALRPVPRLLGAGAAPRRRWPRRGGLADASAGGGASPAVCSRLSPDTSLPPPAGDPVTEMHAPRLSVTKPLAGAAAGTEAACGGRSSSGDEDTGRLGGRAGGCGVHGRLRPGRPHAVSLGAEPAGPRAGDPGHLAAPPGPARVHGREAAGPRSAPRQLLELATGKKRTEDLTSAAAEHIPKAEDAQRRAGAGAARLQGRRRQPLRPR